MACVEPDTAPNIVQAAAVETASPPFTWPTKAMTMSISLDADCPRVMMSAAKMNIGTAISDAGRIPARICCTIVSAWDSPPNMARNPTDAPTISGIIIGKPSKSSTIIVSMMVAAMAQTSCSSSS